MESRYLPKRPTLESKAPTHNLQRWGPNSQESCCFRYRDIKVGCEVLGRDAGHEDARERRREAHARIWAFGSPRLTLTEQWRQREKRKRLDWVNHARAWGKESSSFAPFSFWAVMDGFGNAKEINFPDVPVVERAKRELCNQDSEGRRSRKKYCLALPKF